MFPASAVVVTKRAETRLRRGHPWVFRSDVVRARDLEPGAHVRVVSQQGRLLGTALYSSRSEISLRLLTFGEREPEADWLRARLQAAQRWRARVAPGATAYRLVHGEGDGLPGLVVDCYGPYVALQTLTEASERRKAELVEDLVELLAPAGILERNDPRVRQLEGLERKVGLLHGEVPEQVEIEEHGLRFAVDLWKGQKTGLFLDQRENHLAARDYARGRVLDGFSYNGGFALHVAAQASEVLAVDTSEEAVERIVANAQRNGLGNVSARSANVFDLLRDFDDRGERFDTVILDPPAFAKSRDAVEKATRAYKEINLRALKLLAPGGCLIACSCSYHVHEADFELLLHEAASDAGVAVSLVEKRRQGRDHPVLLGVPETYYLKCFVLRKLQ